MAVRVLIPATPEDFEIGFDPETANAFLRRGIDGLGSPDFTTPTIPHFLAGGLVGGRQTPGSRTLEIDAWTADPDNIAALSGLMDVRPDPTDVFPLTIEDIIVTGSRVLFVRPDGFDYLFDEDAFQSVVGLRLTFLAEDPVIYGAAVTESRSAAGSHSFTATNAGTHATRSGRAWTLELTASGTVVNPWIEIDDGDTARRIDFPVTLTTGQVLTVDHERQTWIGTQRISALPSTPSEDAPDWGVLGVGPNDVDLGADSGSFAVEFVYRSSWL